MCHCFTYTKYYDDFSGYQSLILFSLLLVKFQHIRSLSLQEVDAKPQSLLIEYIKENSWVKILQAYLGAYGLVKVQAFT